MAVHLLYHMAVQLTYLMALQLLFTHGSAVALSHGCAFALSHGCTFALSHGSALALSVHLLFHMALQFASLQSHETLQSVNVQMKRESKRIFWNKPS